VAKEGLVLMENQISTEIIDILARLIRYKMIHWEWTKIIEGQDKETWTNEQAFEALSALVNYKCEEKTST